MNFKIYRFHLLIFSIAFIVFTIIGTVSHELGHYIIAKIRGFDASLHFAHTNWGGKTANNIDNFWIVFGGPLQTMGTGSIAFFILLRKRIKGQDFLSNKINWLWLFLSLFWLRQLFNLIVSIYLKLNNKKGSYFGGDEAFLSTELGLNEGFLSITTAVVSLLICGYLLFKILPKMVRATFLLSGIIGSGLGLWLWFKLLGPMLMS